MNRIDPGAPVDPIMAALCDYWPRPRRSFRAFKSKDSRIPVDPFLVLVSDYWLRSRRSFRFRVVGVVLFVWFACVLVVFARASFLNLNLDIKAIYHVAFQ